MKTSIEIFEKNSNYPPVSFKNYLSHMSNHFQISIASKCCTFIEMIYRWIHRGYCFHERISRPFSKYLNCPASIEIPIITIRRSYDLPIMMMGFVSGKTVCLLRHCPEYQGILHNNCTTLIEWHVECTHCTMFSKYFYKGRQTWQSSLSLWYVLRSPCPDKT